MRSIGELMKELGFNPDSSVDAQKAFIKNMVRAAEEASPAPTPIHIGVPMPKAEDEIPPRATAQVQVMAKKSTPVQLEFDFGSPTQPAGGDSKKVS